MEIWKDIENYENIYQISSEGKVRSLDRINRQGNKIKGRVLKQNDNGTGYKRVHLTNILGEVSVKYVHRLVALAFIPNPENKPEVNHKDSVRDHNNVNNLEWADRKEQYLHSISDQGLRTEESFEKFKTKMNNGYNSRSHPCIVEGKFFYSLRQAAKHFNYIDHRYLQKDIEQGNIQAMVMSYEEACDKGYIVKEEKRD